MSTLPAGTLAPAGGWLCIRMACAMAASGVSIRLSTAMPTMRKSAGKGTPPVAARLYRLSVAGTQLPDRTPSMSRQPPGRRADYRYFHAITTRWMDNDVFRHVNNVNYFSFFDTAVTYWEMTHGVVDLLDGPVHCVVAEVMCR